MQGHRDAGGERIGERAKRWWWGWLVGGGGDCYCAQGHTHADGHHIEISKCTVSLAAPFAVPSSPGDIQMLLVRGHHCFNTTSGRGREIGG